MIATAGTERLCEANDTSALVILYRGQLVTERYWGIGDADAATDVASIQKSIVGILAGSLIEAGTIALDSPASTWLGRRWSKAPLELESRITVRHLMSMTSGLDRELTAFHEPGAAWQYNTTAYHQLRRLVEEASNENIGSLYYRVIGSFAGTTSVTWKPRRNSMDPHGRPLIAMHSTARDLARIGLLVADGLCRDKREIYPGASRFLEEALRPSSAHNPAYGLLWWLPRNRSAVLPEQPPATTHDPQSHSDQSIVSVGPPDLVAAYGASGQKLYVSREAKVVVVITTPHQPVRHFDPAFDNELWCRLSNTGCRT